MLPNKLWRINARGPRGTCGLEQLAVRKLNTSGTPDITHYVHDIFGNVIAETDGGGPTGATGPLFFRRAAPRDERVGSHDELREYIWLPEAEIAPTMGSRTTVDRPIAVVDGVNLATPNLWYVP